MDSTEETQRATKGGSVPSLWPVKKITRTEQFVAWLRFRERSARLAGLSVSPYMEALLRLQEGAK